MNYIHKQPVDSPLVRAKLLPPSPSPLSLSLYKSDLRERERGEGVGGGRGSLVCIIYIKLCLEKKKRGTRIKRYEYLSSFAGIKINRSVYTHNLRYRLWRGEK